MATPRDPSRLFRVLTQLRKQPVPAIPDVQSLTLTYAMRNAHFGARHFVKEELPRIAYSNSSLKIDVQRKLKAKEEAWDPEIVVEFRNGTKKTINMQMKQSTDIFNELLHVAGWKPSTPSGTTPLPEGSEGRRIAI